MAPCLKRMSMRFLAFTRMGFVAPPLEFGLELLILASIPAESLLDSKVIVESQPQHKKRTITPEIAEKTFFIEELLLKKRPTCRSDSDFRKNRIPNQSEL